MLAQVLSPSSVVVGGGFAGSGAVAASERSWPDCAN